MVKRTRLVVFLAYVVRRYWRDEALILAASLAYASLLSMVPLLAIGLGLLAAFPGFESLRNELLGTLFRDLVPEVGAQVQLYVGRFAANAGKLQAAGLVGLVATAVMVLAATERALNRIFRVAQGRAAWARAAVYWAALCVGPLLIGLAFTLSAWFSLIPWIRSMHDWAGRAATAELRALIAGVTPILILTIAFSVLFLVAPNRRVRTADAIVGGGIAALLVMALRAGFGLYIAAWGVYRPVYGGVSAVPIFLAWIYLSWTAVLFGAEVTAAMPELRRGRLESQAPIPPRRRLALALGILAMLVERIGKGGVGRNALMQSLRESEVPLAETLHRLVAARLVIRLGRDRFGSGDLARATLADLLAALELGLQPLDPETGGEAGASPPLARIDGMLAAAAQSEVAALQWPLRELFRKETVAAPADQAQAAEAGINP